MQTQTSNKFKQVVIKETATQKGTYNDFNQVKQHVVNDNNKSIRGMVGNIYYKIIRNTLVLF